MKPNFFKIDYCYFMRRDDGNFTRVWDGNIIQNIAIDIVTPPVIDFTKIMQSSLEEFQEHLNAAINILSITSHIVPPITLKEAQLNNMAQSVDESFIDQESDVQGNNK